MALWFQITGSNHISSETDTINGSATAFAYDGAGNLAQRGTTTYNYDWQNHLFAVNQNGQVTTFGYDADGKLAKRTDPDGTVTDYLGDIYELNEKTGVETKRYDQGTALVATMVNGVRSYLYAESLGSVDGANNGASFLYTPYGLLRLSSGTLPTGRQFQGQQNQSGVGLYPMGARWYDPTIGLWTQPDTLVPNPLDPLALNRYSFALGNPLTHMDPSGHTVALASTLIDIAAPLRVDQAPVQVAAPQVATRLVTTAGPVVGARCIDTASETLSGPEIQTTPPEQHAVVFATSRADRKIAIETDRINNRINEEVDPDTLHAAKQEIPGNIVKINPRESKRHDHIAKVQQAQAGLRNSIDDLQKTIDDVNPRTNVSPLSAEQRVAIEALIAQAQAGLDNRHDYVPEGCIHVPE